METAPSTNSTGSSQRNGSRGEAPCEGAGAALALAQVWTAAQRPSSAKRVSEQATLQLQWKRQISEPCTEPPCFSASSAAFHPWQAYQQRYQCTHQQRERLRCWNRSLSCCHGIHITEPGCACRPYAAPDTAHPPATPGQSSAHGLPPQCGRAQPWARCPGRR